jgi:hypothetical protein
MSKITPPNLSQTGEITPEQVLAEVQANAKTHKEEMDTLRIVMLGVTIVFFLAFIAVAFAYIQFVITDANNRVTTENNLIDKVNLQTNKIDFLIQQLNTPSTKR